MSREIVCPSGLSGEVRGFTVREANLLAQRQAKNARVDVFGKVISNCWERTISPGPYTFDDDRPDWSKVLTGDRFCIVIETRIETYDEVFSFPLQCPDSPCRTKFTWDMDLNQLPYKEYPDDTIARVTAGDLTFNIQVGSNEVKFKLQTGADEARYARPPGTRDDQITTSLLRRIEDISGVHANDRKKWINNMPLRALVDILARLDEVDGGIETSYDFTCPECAHEWEQEIPFDRRDFFLPLRRRSR